MKEAGADLSVLLRGNAVNYAVTGQDASGLTFGADRQTQPPRLAEDLQKLVGKGVTVYVVSEDLAARGIAREEIIGGLALLPRAELPKLFGEFDHVWAW
jgi:sulfur transfer complex TusBCD TusB component (DsrH family)